jgi:hypothetical protein
MLDLNSGGSSSTGKSKSNINRRDTVESFDPFDSFGDGFADGFGDGFGDFDDGFSKGGT